MTSDSREMNDSFKTFYYHLYKSEPPCEGIQFPTLSEEGRAHLDTPIQLSELSDAMTSMKGGKAAVPDRIPINTYKAFMEKLLPALLKMLEKVFEKGCLPPTLQCALITGIVKPGQQPLWM